MSAHLRRNRCPRLWTSSGAGILWLAIVLFCRAASAQDVTAVLLVSKEPVASGATLSVWLVVLNVSDRAATYAFPPSVEFLVRGGGTRYARTATLRNVGDAGPAAVPPSGHSRREYLLTLPEGLEGQVVISAGTISANAVAFEVSRADTVAKAPAVSSTETVTSPTPPTTPETEQESSAVEFFKEHVSGYQPFYFIAGPEYPNAKFQISFKYQLFSDTGYLAKNFPAIKGLHLAYTQTSLWDLTSTSKPFVDTSYKPEVFYTMRRVDGGRWADWFRLDLQAGLQHESNGKSGVDSRSLNIAYVEPTLWAGNEDGFRFSLAPRVWTYLGSLDENPNIKDYRGYVGIRSTLGWGKGLLLSATGRLGDDGNKGSLELDLSYPLMQFLYRNLGLYIYGQYFVGYGESLLRYDERSWAARFGFAIFR
jgi:outer membrane phospholipase A